MVDLRREIMGFTALNLSKADAKSIVHCNVRGVIEAFDDVTVSGITLLSFSDIQQCFQHKPFFLHLDNVSGPLLYIFTPDII